MKVSSIKAGDVLFDCHMYRMGNTTMRTMGTWRVRIIEIDHEAETAIVSWNGNRPEKWYRRQLQNLRRSPVKERGQ